jgi:hypothetical protein
MLPDTSDAERMAHIGRLTVLRKARRDLGQKLRDKVVNLLNNMEQPGQSWDVSGVVELVQGIEEINRAIEEL